jgi:hypothetical protein
VPDTRLVYVADREGDLRALIDAAARRGAPVDWLIRSQHNRKTTTGEKLWDRLAQSDPLGEVEFILPAAPDRPARLVRQTLYRTVVTLPAHHGQPAVTVTALLAREEQPPTGEKAIEWRLLTNRAADTLEAVVELIDWYRKRWLIEIFFRIWKSGCRVEALQLGTLERLERALVIYLIIAWRILHLVTWGRDGPNLPCDVVFDPEEWQAAWIVAHRTQPPATPPPLGQMVRLIAGFGGFLGRKHDGHPGPKAIWEGMQKVRAFALALEATAVPRIPVTDEVVGNRVGLNAPLGGACTVLATDLSDGKSRWPARLPTMHRWPVRTGGQCNDLGGKTAPYAPRNRSISANGLSF